jgi:hypothetical protein
MAADSPQPRKQTFTASIFVTKWLQQAQKPSPIRPLRFSTASHDRWRNPYILSL